MFSFLKRVTGGGVAEGVNATTGLVGTVFGSKTQREANQHAENMSVHQQHAAEYQYKGSRFWLDSLVDGLNRLVRPAFTYGIVAIFGWAVWGSKDFLDFAARLSAVPEPLWIVMGTIIAFWFGSRSIFKDRMKYTANPKVVEAAYKSAGKIRAMMSAEEEILKQSKQDRNETLELYADSRHERKL